MKEDTVFFTSNNDLPFYAILCGISYCDSNYRIERKSSELNVIEYIISGTGTIVKNDKLFHPCEGDIYLLTQGNDHLYFSDKKNPWTKIWLNFSGILSKQIIEDYGLGEKVCFHAPELKEYFFKLYELACSGIDARTFSCKSAVYFLEMAQRLSSTDEDISKRGIAADIKAIIDNSSNFSIKLEDIADSLSYSKNHIIRTFKEAYGLTPYEYILNKKFDTATLLLKNTSYTINEISEKLGFCCDKYFSSCFSKRYNISPKMYRNSTMSK